MLSNTKINIPIITNRLRDVISKADMRCGGCGSKVGSQVLTRALKRVKNRIKSQHQNSNTLTPTSTNTKNILSQLGDDDAAVCIPPPSPYLSVHTIDYFKSCDTDPYLFGQIAATHALSDIFAMNAIPTNVLALCVIPYALGDVVEDTLVQLLAGAVDVFEKEKCALVGGHTTEGHDLSLGFSINGQVLPENILRKGPLQPDTVLILTKPLGTGTILAANMRVQAKASWMSQAFQSMLQSNKQAANILYEHQCTACTDVTGFGLLGHLIEMMKSTNTEIETDNDDTLANDISTCNLNGKFALPITYGVTLNLTAIPSLNGAEISIGELGITSSLHSENMRNAMIISNLIDFDTTTANSNNIVVNIDKESSISKQQPPLSKFHLLFDPQTSGGLLGAVPRDQAVLVIEKLKAAGYTDAAVVGEVTLTHPGNVLLKY